MDEKKVSIENVHGYCHDYIRGFEVRIESLEEENAELKTKCESCQHEYKKKKDKLYRAGDEFVSKVNEKFRLVTNDGRLLLLFIENNSLFTKVWDSGTISLKDIRETWMPLTPVEK